MAAQQSFPDPNLGELSALLFAVQEVVPRARIITEFVAVLLRGSAVILYLLSSSEEGDAWLPKSSAGEVALHEAAVPAVSEAFAKLAQQKQPLSLQGKHLVRESYSHLDVRRTVASLGYLPILHGDELLGAIEILTFDHPISPEHLSALSGLAALADASLVAAQNFEQDRNDSLSSINRLTQLYDLEKTFASTLEMDRLLPLIGSKFREVLECEAVNVWLLEPDESVRLMHQSGDDPTVSEGSSHKPGQGIPGDISDNGEPVILSDPSEDRLLQRNATSRARCPIAHRRSHSGQGFACRRCGGN
jgi:transcriptional regulator with GAF, ATPase, and Fis domain